MKSSERENYVRYRLEKSEETYEVAELLVKHEKWNSAVNRLYYATYYAVTGLLVIAEIPTKTHTGVKTQFFQNYIKPGKIDVKMGKLYADLFDWRQRGDYGDFFDFTQKDVEPLMEPTKELIEAIKREIEKEG